MRTGDDRAAILLPTLGSQLRGRTRQRFTSQSHSADRLASALSNTSLRTSPTLPADAKATSVPHVCLESGRSKRPDLKCAVFALEGRHNSVEPIQHLEGHPYAVVRGCRALDHAAIAIEATFIAAPAGLRCAELLRERTRRLSPPLVGGRAAGSILPRLHNHSGSPSCARISIQRRLAVLRASTSSGWRCGRGCRLDGTLSRRSHTSLL